MSSKPVPLTTQLQCSHISLYMLPRSFKSLPGNTHFSPELPLPIALPHTRQVESFWSQNAQWSGIILFREFPLSTGIPSGYSLIPELKDNLLVFWAEGPQNNKFMRFPLIPLTLSNRNVRLNDNLSIDCGYHFQDQRQIKCILRRWWLTEMLRVFSLSTRHKLSGRVIKQD